MASNWHKKKEKLASIQFEKELAESGNNFSERLISNVTREAAMGGGDEELFEKKLNKDEKKARAKAQRDLKKKAKIQAAGIEVDEDGNSEEEDAPVKLEVQMSKNAGADGLDYDQADKLAGQGTICTFSTSRKGVDARSRDVNVQNFTLQHKGAVLLDETEIILNHGNRYGLIGRNGCGKVRMHTCMYCTY